MNERRPLTWLISSALAFCVGFGGVGCLISGHSLSEINLPLLCVGCIFGALGLSLCFICRKPLAAVIALAVIALFTTYFGDLPGSVKLLLNAISKVYSKAYGWGIVKVSKELTRNGSMNTALFMLGLLTAAPTAWVVCSGKPIWPAAMIGVLPLLGCLLVTDKVPSPGYLFIFLLGMLILLLTQTLRRSSTGEGSRLALYLALPSALALLLLFALLPRSGYSGQDKAETMAWELFGWLPRGPAYGSGSAAYSIELQDIGSRSEHEHSVMNVTASPSGPLYLRGAAYDVYSGLTWSVSDSEWTMDETKDWRVSTAYQSGESVHISTDDVHSVLYIPQTPGSSSAVSNLEWGRVRNTDRLTQYSFLRTKAPAYNRSWNILRADLSGASQYLQLPDTTRQTADELLAKADISPLGSAPTATQVYGTAIDIALLVRDSAEYDLTPRVMPSDETDFVLWFLEDAESGLCTHYASAAAVLLRAANIPARFVTGYMVFEPAGRDTEVTQANAHAWVEYYLPGVGWQLLESTPPFAQALEPFVPELSVGAEAPQSTPAPIQPTPTPTPVLPTPTPTPAPQTDTGRQPTRPLSPADNGTSIPALIFIIPILAIAAAAVFLQSRVRLSRKERNSRTGSTNQQYLFCWSWAEPLAARLGEKPPEELLTLAKKAKYSRHAISTDELRAMRRYLNSVTFRQPAGPFVQRFTDRIIYALY